MAKKLNNKEVEQPEVLTSGSTVDTTETPVIEAVNEPSKEIIIENPVVVPAEAEKAVEEPKNDEIDMPQVIRGYSYIWNGVEY